MELRAHFFCTNLQTRSLWVTFVVAVLVCKTERVARKTNALPNVHTVGNNIQNREKTTPVILGVTLAAAAAGLMVGKESVWTSCVWQRKIDYTVFELERERETDIVKQCTNHMFSRAFLSWKYYFLRQLLWTEFDVWTKLNDPFSGTNILLFHKNS